MYFKKERETMHRLAKTISLVMALVLISCLLISCGSENQSDTVTDFLEDDEAKKTLKDNLKLAWSPKNLKEEFFVKATEGFKAYCEIHKYSALVANPNGSKEEQYSEFENWVAMEVDAIAAVPVDTMKLQDMITAANEKGIIVSGFYATIPGADFNYTVDEYNLGYMMGQNALRWINEMLKGKGRVFLLLNDTDELLQIRGNGIEDALSEANVKVVDSKSADSVPDAKNAAIDVLEANKYINVIVCINDEYASGVAEVAADLKLDTENLYIGGAGYTKDAITDMDQSASPFRSTVNLSPYESGKLLAKMMAESVVYGVKEKQLNLEPESYWQKTLGWN